MSEWNVQRMVAAAAVCAVVGAGAGIAGSAAAPSKGQQTTTATTPGTTTAPSAPTGPKRDHRGLPPFGPGGPAIHSESVVPNATGDGFVTIVSDAGTVKSVDGDKLTLTEGTKTKTYKEPTLTIPSDATIIRNGAKASLSDLKAGDMARVVSGPQGTFVMAVDAAHRYFDRGPRGGHRFFRPGGDPDHDGRLGPGRRNGAGPPLPPAPPAAQSGVQ